MDFLQTWLDNTEWPVLSAFLLGLMTAVSPCPLATNITAIGFIGRDIENRRKVFYNGLLYTLGRAISYTALGLVFYFGASMFKVASLFQGWGEKLLGPLLIVIGLFMLDVIRINFGSLSGLSEKIGNKSKRIGFMGPLLLGLVFALAFCPYSGVLYFGMLIPMTIASPSGLWLPLVFALATGLPVIAFAWLIAFAVGGVGTLYNRIKVFEVWSRRVIAILFMLTGVYLIVVAWL
ncbi:MAG: aromatic aminobenezylarsenical efflux permease ArsG family transporter [Bacteroidales bacterium]|nr:aromatic aminobenezylarsenical efflux permease ArsG family transporter [Bacteroidales bacterium]MDD3666185.1 aromatic aminobenezylarsenical efflux permease ArsG family transporter [Bacteroidales bacterium]